MPKLIRALLILAALLLAACGSTSKLRTESAAARKQIGDYTRVEVADFAVTATKDTKDDHEAQAKYQAQLAEARARIADLIAEQITERAAFDEVSRAELEGTALRVSGTITRYEEGNVAARMVTGFVGQAHFEATVTVSDRESGEVLGNFIIDRNSWPLPIGASSNVVQTVEFFAREQARNVSSELIKAKGGKVPAR